MATAVRSTEQRRRFASFEVDPRAGELFRNGRRVRVQQKPLELLLALLERAGEVVTRDELRRRLWPDQEFGEFDNGLNTAVNKLREALGDSAERPRFLETLPRRGYRFIAAVEPAAVADVVADPASEPTPARRSHGFLAVLIALALVAGAVWAVGRTAAPLPQGRSRTAGRALDLYLAAARNLRDTTPDLAKAVRDLRAATKIAPRFAAAHVALGEALARQALPPLEKLPPARAAFERALELDSTLADAHRQLAAIQLYFDRDFAAAGRSFERAAALAPASSQVHHARAGYLSALGRHDEALRSIERAFELDPLSVTLQADAGWYLFIARQYAAAIARCDAALRLEPEHTGALSYRLASQTALGDVEASRATAIRLMRARHAARDEIDGVASANAPAGLSAFHRWNLQRLEAQAREAYLSPSVLALAHLEAGDRERALEQLERAHQERSGWLLAFLDVHPGLDPLRSEPRLQALRRQASRR